MPLVKAYKTHPIASLSLIELCTQKEELQSKCYDEMVRQWETFKEHFRVSKNCPLVERNLEDVVDWYFEQRTAIFEQTQRVSGCVYP